MESLPEKHCFLLDSNDSNQTESNPKNENVPLSFWFREPSGYWWTMSYQGSPIIVEFPQYKQHSMSRIDDIHLIFKSDETDNLILDFNHLHVDKVPTRD